MKTVAILQSNYIPWKGYFDLLNSVDEFVLYDTAQYTKNDWRNRNLIKSPKGEIWLTIPVKRNSLQQKINETYCLDSKWRNKHWQALKSNYARAPHFKEYADTFEELYRSSTEKHLSSINRSFIEAINQILGITTKISRSEDFELKGDRSEKLLNICQQAGASHYLSGPAAAEYLKLELFENSNITVNWMDYSNYREYSQLHPPFTHKVSILDLLFNQGKESKAYMKSFKHD